MKRSETDEASLASSVGTSTAIVQQWLDGGKNPSFTQARRIASKLRIPFGFLFLNSPPPDTLPIPDLRTIDGQRLDSISIDLRDVVLSTLRKQDWLSHERKQNGKPPVSIVGKSVGNTSASSVATEIRRWLGLLAPSQRGSSADDFLRELTKVIEKGGVSVLRSGVVGNNTSRQLKVEDFRGFAISDKYAPFIFINSVDAKQAQVFTLIHELAHIWQGDSGISGAVEEASLSSETFCNQIAADVLVPPAEFREIWQHEEQPQEAVRLAARHFHTSRYVIAIRAFESGFITRSVLNQLFTEYRNEIHEKKPGGGGNFYKTLISRNGRSFTQDVVESVGRQRILVRDAASLLDAKPGQLSQITKELHGV